MVSISCHLPHVSCGLSSWASQWITTILLNVLKSVAAPFPDSEELLELLGMSSGEQRAGSSRVPCPTLSGYRKRGQALGTFDCVSLDVAKQFTTKVCRTFALGVSDPPLPSYREGGWGPLPKPFFFCDEVSLCCTSWP